MEKSTHLMIQTSYAMHILYTKSYILKMYIMLINLWCLFIAGQKVGVNR